VREQVNDGFERLGRAPGTAREIQDQRLFAHSAKSSTERCQRSLFGTFETHAFRHAFEKAGTDGAGGFWSDVTRGDARSACRGHQPGFPGQADDCFFNRRLMVGYDFSCDYGEFFLLKNFCYGGPGEIGALAAG
jgi:hypothetical protein